jgi:hypothetical protein
MKNIYFKKLFIIRLLFIGLLLVACAKKTITPKTITLIDGKLIYSGTPPYIFPIKTTITPLTNSGIKPDDATLEYLIKTY